MPRRGSIGHIVFAPVTFARWRGRIVWIPDEGITCPRDDQSECLPPALSVVWSASPYSSPSETCEGLFPKGEG